MSEVSRRRFLVATIVTSSGVIVGCGNDKGSSAPQATAGGSTASTTVGSIASGGTVADGKVATLTIGVNTLAEQFVDPHLAIRSGGLWGVRVATSENLYQLDYDLKLVPNLATAYQVSADGLTWTFTLRDDVTMHDGSRFTARDVKTAVDRILGSDEFAAGYAAFRTYTVGATVIDNTHVQIVTKTPSVTLPHDIPVPIPTDYYNRVGDQAFRAQPMQAGPFKFASKVTNDNVTLERFDNYFDPSRRANYKTLVYKIVPDESSRIAGIKTKALDVVWTMSTSAAKQVDGSDGAKVVEVPDTALVYVLPVDMAFPNGGSPLLNVNVRKALLLALDRDAIAKGLYSGYARTAPSAAPPALLGYDASAKPMPYDPDQAKQLLRGAGAAGMQLVLNTANNSSNTPDIVKLAEAIVAYWQAVGIDAKLNVLDSAAFLADWRAKKLKGTLLTASGPVANTEPANMLKGFLTTNANFPNISVPAMDQLLVDVGAAVDTAKRTQLGAQLQKTLDTELYAIPLVLISTLIGIGPNVASFKPQKGNPFNGPTWGLVAK